MSVEDVSCGTNWDTVRKAICSGYFHNAAKLRGIGEYVNLRTSVPCHLHATSALYGSGQIYDYVVYHEVVMTTKEYMNHTTAVDPYWLAERGGMFFRIKSSMTDRAGKKREEAEEQERLEAEHSAKIEYERRAKAAVASETPVGPSRIFMPGVKAPREAAEKKGAAFMPSLQMEDDAEEDGELMSKRTRKAPPQRKRMVFGGGSA